MKNKSKNSNLHTAKKEKNDEFYTQLSDIENELKHYEEHFKGNVIYCNCDSPKSNFVKYFNSNKERLGIEKVIHTWYDKDTGEGSFDSPENIELLKEADIIVTNPPFSLFRQYIDLLMQHDKKFLVIGNMNASTNDKNIFKYVLEGKLWLGVNSPKDFILPDNSIKSVYTCWFTNLTHKKKKEKLILYRKYNPTDYLFYDNTEIINVDKTKDIPCDWNGIMGIPISALNKLSPEQFEIVGATNNKHEKGVSFTSYIRGKKTYARLLVKLKTQNNADTSKTN